MNEKEQLEYYYKIKQFTNKRAPFIGKLVKQILDRAQDYQIEDLVHDAFIEVLEHTPTDPFEDWLYNFYRRKLRTIKKRVITVELKDQLSTEDIDQHTESDMKEKVQEEIIRVLGEDVYCMLGEGKTLKEAADYVGMNYNTIKDKIRRLRKSTLKMLINNEEIDLDGLCLYPKEQD